MAGGAPHVLFDFSKFVDQYYQDAPSGIGRVNVEFARWLAETEAFRVTGIHARYGIVTRFGRSKLARMARDIEQEWARGEDRAIGGKLRDWLARPDRDIRRIHLGDDASKRHRRKVVRIIARWPWHTVLPPLPRGSLYLNVSYGNLQHPKALDWLDRRTDIRPVFMVHDLLPLDHPELFWPALRQQFPVQIEHILRRGKLVIVPSAPVKERLIREAGRFGRHDLAVEVAALPPAPAFLSASRPEAMSSPRPYFVVCSTIEPRKGHGFLLALWRDMARRLGDACPLLVIAGARGWNNEAVFTQLDRAEEISGHVLEVNNLPNNDLVALLAGARALLMPSDDEGYGMPVVEALSLGVPVLASDIPVFRSVTKGCATLLSQRDPAAWEAALLALCNDEGQIGQARLAAARFHAPTWSAYFHRLADLLQGLPR